MLAWVAVVKQWGFLCREHKQHGEHSCAEGAPLQLQLATSLCVLLM